MEMRNNWLTDPAQGLSLTAQFQSIPLPSAPTSAVSKGVQLEQTLASVQCAKLESYFLFPGTSSARGYRCHKSLTSPVTPGGTRISLWPSFASAPCFWVPGILSTDSDVKLCQLLGTAPLNSSELTKPSRIFVHFLFSPYFLSFLPSILCFPSFLLSIKHPDPVPRVELDEHPYNTHVAFDLHSFTWTFELSLATHWLFR